MAPFKLKFRMGSSRSTSQDTDTESSASSHHQNLANQLNGAQQPLLHAQHRSPTNSAAGISTTTLDSIDFPSLNANEQRNLLPSNSNNSVSNHSYTNPTLIDTRAELINGCVPQSPPPSYEFVLEENRLASLDKDNNPRHITTSPSNSLIRAASPNASIASSLHSAVDNLRRNASSPISTASSHSRSTSSLNQQRLALLESPAFSYSAMSAPSEEDLLGNIDGSSDPLFAAQSDENIEHNSDECPNDNATASTLVGDGSASTLRRQINCGDHQLRRHPNNNDGSFSDSEAEDSINCMHRSDNDNHQHCIQLSNEYYANNDDHNLNVDEEGSSHWDDDNRSSYSHQTNLYQEDELSPDTYINNKSTKELYKAVAKKLGITCKMSSQCRCIDCQSNYFDCEYEENDHQKSDGGLGASTPMFVSEVMHGTTCTIL